MKRLSAIIRKGAAAAGAALLLAALLALPISAHTFTDVTKYSDAIGLLNDIGVIKGYSTTVFAPNDNVTRWQMALLIAKLRTGDTETSVWTDTTGTTVFADVDANAHYPAAIRYAQENGIIIGWSGAGGRTIFDPTGSITVQDGATMLIRALGYPRAQYDGGYPMSYTSKAKELGLYDGLYNIADTDTLTRGQIAQMMYNALFAKGFDGSTLASGVFGFVDADMVLAATEDLRIDSAVPYAQAGKLRFCTTDGYGRLGDSYAVSQFDFPFGVPDECIGMMVKITATADLSKVIRLEKVSKTMSAAKTASLSVNTADGTVTLGGAVYTPKTVRSYVLENGKAPSSREIQLYALSESGTSGGYASGSMLTAAKLSGCTDYYTAIAYDDNNDGYIDRCFLRTGRFGQYKTVNGKVALAGGQAASAVTLTGAAAEENDYVISSYDPQTKTLEILKVLNAAEGTVTAVDPAAGTLTVNGTVWQLGSSGTPGATRSDVTAGVALSTLNGKSVSIVVDPEAKRILSLKTVAVPASLSGNYYHGNCGMVSGVDIALLAPQNSLGGAAGAHSSAEYSACLVVTLDGGSTKYILRSLDGAVLADNDLFTALSVGDMLAWTQLSSVSYYMDTSGAISSYQSCDFTRVNGSATYTASAASILYYHAGRLVCAEWDGSAYVERQSYAVSDAAKVVISDGSGKLTVLTASSLAASESWQYEKGSARRTGYTAFSGSTGYASFFLSGRDSAVPDTIYIRPFDLASYSAGTTAYTGIVYIPAASIQSASVSTSGGNVVYTYAGAYDLGGSTTVSAVSVRGKLTTAGYYRALGGYISDTAPIASDLTTDSLALFLSPTVSVQTSVSYSGVTINGKVYWIPAGNVRIAVTTGTSMTPVTSAAEASVYMNMLESGTAIPKAVFLPGGGSYVDFICFIL